MKATQSRPGSLLDEGTLTFTIESRIIREIGERLVKQPEVALVELIKNAYDADAKKCDVTFAPPHSVSVVDDGHGMSLTEFKSGWMRIGTSSKESQRLSRRLNRVITGEKGIGRFAVRFLGRVLHLESVAQDRARGFRTLLTADFDWPTFDITEDLGQVKVPYTLERADPTRNSGTTLLITDLREAVTNVDLDAVRTASIAVVTPYHALLRPEPSPGKTSRSGKVSQDPGFALRIEPSTDAISSGDVADAVLKNAMLRAVVELEDDRVNLKVYGRDSRTPLLKINDKYPNTVGRLYADIRFFPQRKGSFTELPVDGRAAKTWVRQNAGVAVFDRKFRVLPYGSASDDWLLLAADTARRAREPRSTIARKHFPMDEPTHASTQLNYMLRLPYPNQLVGIVQVEGRRSIDQLADDAGLIPAADREGFVDNAAFKQLKDVVRGAVEAIANADREVQLQQERAEREALVRSLRKETRSAIREIEANPNIRRVDKARIVRRLAQTQVIAEKHEERTREREATLEIMSLLGVVAGFMTHEFGVALDELEKAQRKIAALGSRDGQFSAAATALAAHGARLREFVTYSQGYIQGTSARPLRPYAARPRIQQVVRVFGKYATDRGIDIQVDVEGDLVAPLVPVSLYNGIALNLYSNALKAVTAKAGGGDRRIAFRAWNEQSVHFLEVSDTGIGIPTVLRERIFDPLFTTTDTNQDPLGSGMGLGLALVKRGVESFGGHVEVAEPPPGFVTCIRMTLPMAEA